MTLSICIANRLWSQNIGPRGAKGSTLILYQFLDEQISKNDKYPEELFEQVHRQTKTLCCRGQSSQGHCWKIQEKCSPFKQQIHPNGGRQAITASCIWKSSDINKTEKRSQSFPQEKKYAYTGTFKILGKGSPILEQE